MTRSYNKIKRLIQGFLSLSILYSSITNDLVIDQSQPLDKPQPKDGKYLLGTQIKLVPKKAFAWVDWVWPNWGQSVYGNYTNWNAAYNNAGVWEAHNQWENHTETWNQYSNWTAYSNYSNYSNYGNWGDYSNYSNYSNWNNWTPPPSVVASVQAVAFPNTTIQITATTTGTTTSVTATNTLNSTGITFTNTGGNTWVGYFNVPAGTTVQPITFNVTASNSSGSSNTVAITNVKHFQNAITR
ncbi:hypothetical protein [Dehalobacter sp. 14DCB1]|uniref:hypothetical protein n=1 Tax=Dehalobacter sp. 14DCB1 TaxID=2070227 RepID=UPI001048CED6|nr:hypothetical protein [Dehalobacter sp. 14DCB1]TCX48924.1 hypothetical protein C1I36_12735 [Dehalobacter sp. 14DCB1]